MSIASMNAAMFIVSMDYNRRMTYEGPWRFYTEQIYASFGTCKSNTSFNLAWLLTQETLGVSFPRHE